MSYDVSLMQADALGDRNDKYGGIGRNGAVTADINARELGQLMSPIIGQQINLSFAISLRRVGGVHSARSSMVSTSRRNDDSPSMSRSTADAVCATLEARAVDPGLRAVQVANEVGDLGPVDAAAMGSSTWRKTAPSPRRPVRPSGGRPRSCRTPRGAVGERHVVGLPDIVEREQFHHQMMHAIAAALDQSEAMMPRIDVKEVGAKRLLHVVGKPEAEQVDVEALGGGQVDQERGLVPHGQPRRRPPPRDVAQRAVEAILGAAKTGKIGDGKIFVTEVEEAVRIRTGERGTEAL